MNDAPLTWQLVDAVCGIARQAGEEIMAVYRSGHIAAQMKADDSPLTQADLRAHRSILAGLGTLTPNLPVLSEESAGSEFLERRKWRRYWLVDPLDGTKEFLSRNGEFTVNIALIDVDAPVLGVVQIPASGEVYAGACDLGAVRIDAGNTRVAIQVRGAAANPLRVVGSRSHGSAASAPILAQMGNYEFAAVGSSLKFCRVAEGTADLYPRIGPTSEWDTAAGQAVLEAAGGRMRRLPDGQAMRYNGGEDFLNPNFIAYGDEACWERWQRAAG
ncbi:MAG: 3'(2'),5'-bisphosphate nucleotidase CysQ [Steroidobacteraceae bacterium]